MDYKVIACIYILYLNPKNIKFIILQEKIYSSYNTSYNYNR